MENEDKNQSGKRTESPLTAQEHIFAANLLGFEDDQVVRLCEPCLRRAVSDDLVVYSYALPITNAHERDAESE